MSDYLQHITEKVRQRNHSEPIFYQAVEEVLASLGPVLDQHPEIEKYNLLERIVEPERQVMFRVTWQDDKGKVFVNRGFRTQFNSALGPYKGGLRFHPTVNMGIVKFLAFEQIFKNSLTGLMIGGAKGGADFDPKGKSEAEVMRFCHSFMSELYRHIGEQTDVPAGDMGVGGREIGFLFGYYKKITNRYESATLTGKDIGMGGSLVRKEATGFGCIYFAQEMLATKGDDLEGKVCVVSGSGNVALYAIKKLMDKGAKVVGCSDSSGALFDPEGLDFEQLRFIKEVQRERLEKYVETRKNAQFKKGEKVWSIPCDCAFPCATQNEISLKDAKELLKNKLMLLSEGANMPTEPDAVKAFVDAGVLYGPAKAANAGGVAVSALEMQQNANWKKWTFSRVDEELKGIMKSIHDDCLSVSEKYDRKGSYIDGANIAGFLRVVEAMHSQGIT